MTQTQTRDKCVTAPPDAARADLKRPPLDEARQRLAAEYLPLAKKLARPLKQAWPHERDEFESAALQALVEAAQSFDASRGNKFTTYATHRITGALRDVQRGLVLAGWRCDMENAPGVVPLCEATEYLGRIIGFKAIRPAGEDFEKADAVEYWLRKLPAKHAEVCRQLYIGSKTQYEVAESLGCSRSRLSYLHQQSLDMLNDIVTWENRRGSHLDN